MPKLLISAVVQVPGLIQDWSRAQLSSVVDLEPLILVLPFAQCSFSSGFSSAYFFFIFQCSLACYALD